ncbi:hypothetical protein CR3_0141 [Cupriavidus gilardii CR3]|nr:hypothetical protein CR3_0141 [Cupriavidus gilardii CR3]
MGDGRNQESCEHVPRGPCWRGWNARRRELRSSVKLPTPVLTGSGSKGLSQPRGQSARHPCFIQRGQFKHKGTGCASLVSFALWCAAVSDRPVA